MLRTTPTHHTPQLFRLTTPYPLSHRSVHVDRWSDTPRFHAYQSVHTNKNGNTPYLQLLREVHTEKRNTTPQASGCIHPNWDTNAQLWLGNRGTSALCREGQGTLWTGPGKTKQTPGTCHEARSRAPKVVRRTHDQEQTPRQQQG